MSVMRKYSTALDQMLLTRQTHVSVVIVVIVTTIICTGVCGYTSSQHYLVTQHPNNAIRYDQHLGSLLHHSTHQQDNTDRSLRSVGRYTLMKVLHNYLHTPLHLDYLRHVKSPKTRLPATIERTQHLSEVLRKR
jgi:K+ transporter